MISGMSKSPPLYYFFSIGPLLRYTEPIEPGRAAGDDEACCRALRCLNHIRGASRPAMQVTVIQESQVSHQTGIT